MKKEYTKEDFPKKAIYRRSKNRIYFMTDFKDGEMVEFIGVQTAGRGDVEFWAKSYVIEKGGKDYEIKSEDAIFIGYSENLRDGSVRIKNSLTGEKYILEKVD